MRQYFLRSWSFGQLLLHLSFIVYRVTTEQRLQIVQIHYQNNDSTFILMDNAHTQRPVRTKVVIAAVEQHMAEDPRPTIVTVPIQVMADFAEGFSFVGLKNPIRARIKHKRSFSTSHVC